MKESAVKLHDNAWIPQKPTEYAQPKLYSFFPYLFMSRN